MSDDVDRSALSTGLPFSNTSAPGVDTTRASSPMFARAVSSGFFSVALFFATHG